MQRPSVALVTLGCPKNQVDSEVMLGQLAQAGLRVVEDAGRADVVIVNTCGFIDTAKEESINTIIELGELKKTGQCRALIATGCLTQRYQGELLKELPELDAIVGTGDFPKIAEIAQSQLGKKSRSTREWFEHPTFLYDAATPRRRIGPRHWAYVKISEGCDKRCSFCAIPSFRGDLASRSVESIVSEVRQLAAEGVREINLIAQDLPAFGMDHGRKGELIPLIRELAAINGVLWIRPMYLYPHKLPAGLIDLFVDEPKVVPYVEMPIQHIDDAILRRMNRGGTSAEIRKILDAFRERVPGVAIRTSFIVGFPGESDAAFERLAAFVEEQRFDRIAVFTYSMEEGTTAAPLDDPISPEIKTERRQRLLDLQLEIAQDKGEDLVGSRRPVMIEGPAQDAQFVLEARMATQAPEIDGVVYLTEDVGEPGDVVEVTIDEAMGFDLVASPLVRSSKLTVL
ncbi:MAG: 30S ribosomal protein S12 methylthiotransferase RimO [Nitrospirota bacterium]